MNRVFGIGPLEMGDGEGEVYMLTLMHGGFAVRMETAPTPVEALREIVMMLGGAPLIASPDLADAARELGLAVENLPEDLRMFRVIQALILANGEDLGRGPRIELLELLPALIAYIAAGPWHWLGADAPVRVEYRRPGRSTTTLEASVLGGTGGALGLALYDRCGTVAKLPEGGPVGGEILQHDAVMLRLDSDPQWAADIMDETFGLRMFPSFLRVRAGAVSPVSSTDLRRLAGALWALAQLEAGARLAWGELANVEGGITRVQVEIELRPN